MVQIYLSVGEVSERSGLPVSTLHFYERKGLIASTRSGANHRVYRRDVLRRVAVLVFRWLKSRRRFLAFRPIPSLTPRIGGAFPRFGTMISRTELSC